MLGPSETAPGILGRSPPSLSKEGYICDRTKVHQIFAEDCRFILQGEIKQTSPVLLSSEEQ